MATFPHEILELIVDECDAAGLAAFAAVNKTFQDQSERLLYRNVSTDPRFKRTGEAGPLEILSKSPQKASYLKALSVRLSPVPSRIKYVHTLARVLRSATSLVDLRIAQSLPTRWESNVVLKAIQEGPFTLEFLFVPSCIPLSAILPHQQPMRAVGHVAGTFRDIGNLLSGMNHLVTSPMFY
ncbi:hypothetical protein BKA70DRAFT_854883 [Coprinopsis sp. MPI-PUGE-AT-0042]|nr:hypothetical protein BKA70DRAFT_854883 [Coprinopsis sp. MPI-PUGE-AT-0042]